MRRMLIPVLLLLGVAMAGSTAARVPGAAYPTATKYGVVQELDFDRSEMIVSGTRYRVAFDVAVEIGGSYGAFTLLRPGMKIHYAYLVISPSEREITEIREIPPNAYMEEV
jgi:hypothetical protein